MRMERALHRRAVTRSYISAPISVPGGNSIPQYMNLPMRFSGQNQRPPLNDSQTRYPDSCLSNVNGERNEPILNPFNIYLKLKGLPFVS